ncbi:MAG TPA: response regulator [Acetobacteraceae bacterium]|nr:response regulator [Acetobacteraceae bacterium]
MLIVEDEYFVATAAEAALVDAGYHVVDMAATADEAVALAERLRPDIVLMDIRLRAERDGIDAASAIRERFGIPTLFATAHGDSNTRRLGEAARPIGWLFKPYTPTQVVAAVQIAVRRMRG